MTPAGTTMPGFSAQASLVRSRGSYGGRTLRHARRGIPAGAVVPASVDCDQPYLDYAWMCIQGALDSFGHGDWDQGGFHLAEAQYMLAMDQYCHGGA
jgi:hypothetical protein